MTRLKLLLTVAILSVMVSCNKEKLETSTAPSSGEPITVNSTMSVTPMTVQMADPSTKSTGGDLDVTYGALPGSKVLTDEEKLVLAQESAIKTLSVIQFVDNTTTSKVAVSIDVNKLERQPDDSYLIPLELLPSNIEGRIYFLANIPAVTAKAYTEAEIRLLTVPSDETFNLDVAGLPMIGIYEGKVFDGVDLHNINLERLFAKIVFTYTLPDNITGLTPKSIQLKNVAKNVPVDTNRITGVSLVTANIPLHSTSNFVDYDVKEMNATDLKTYTYTKYIAPNLKGINVNITDERERIMLNVPAARVNSKATYVCLLGTVEATTFKKALTYSYNFLLGNTVRSNILPANKGGGGMGNFNVERNTIYNVSATINGTGENENGTSDGRVAIYYGDGKHMSNSAIIRPSVPVMFNLNKIYQGNRTVGDLGNFKEAFDRGDLTFEIVWKDCYNVVSLVYSVIGDNVTIEWTDPSVKGNAIVAAKDADGVILWSWHLWHSDYDPDAAKLLALATTPIAKNAKWGTIGSSEVHTYGTEFEKANPNKVMMDRNLGAMMAHYETPESNEDAEEAWGLMYQWGRKDPVPRGTMRGTVTCYPSLGYAHNLMPVGTAAVKGTALQYSIENPLTFITADVGVYDWYTTVGALQKDHLWATLNGDKGVYDPCPDGWRVPTDVASTWADFKIGNGYSWSTFSSTSRSGGLYRIDDGVSTWYGALGRKMQNGEFGAVGARGYLWTSTTDGSNAEGGLFPANSNVSREVRTRVHGISVRCISE